MTRKTKAQLAAEAAEELMLRTARDLGRELFGRQPDMALVAVARASATLFNTSKDQQIAYLQGYIEARSHHDAFKRGE